MAAGKFGVGIDVEQPEGGQWHLQRKLPQGGLELFAQAAFRPRQQQQFAGSGARRGCHSGRTASAMARAVCSGISPTTTTRTSPSRSR